RRLHTRFSRDWSSDVCSSDLRTGELTTLVRIYYVRFTIARNCLFQDSQAVLCLQRIVQVPAYHKPTVQVDNGSEIHEPMSHRYVGDVYSPHLVCVRNFEIPE